MRSFVVVVALLFAALCAVAQNAPMSDLQAVTLAQQSMAKLTRANPVVDVTLNANIISSNGIDSNSGTGTLYAKGTAEGRLDVTVNNVTRSDVRNSTGASPAGAWKRKTPAFTTYPQHNCWTDAAWFFPALSALSQTANPRFIFKYVAQEQYNGANAQHIQIFQYDPNVPFVAPLSAMDFYLDASSFIPLGIRFNIHADNDMNINIPSEVRFAMYQQVTGIQVPFHIQRVLNGDLVLDVTVSSAVINSGLIDSIFSLQ
jgi:hypothetical protein